MNIYSKEQTTVEITKENIRPKIEEIARELGAVFRQLYDHTPLDFIFTLASGVEFEVCATTGPKNKKTHLGIRPKWVTDTSNHNHKPSFSHKNENGGWTYEEWADYPDISFAKDPSRIAREIQSRFLDKGYERFWMESKRSADQANENSNIEENTLAELYKLVGKPLPPKNANYRNKVTFYSQREKLIGGIEVEVRHRGSLKVEIDLPNFAAFTKILHAMLKD
jgi:hypothetical protein